jgi:hypothetical protein
VLITPLRADDARRTLYARQGASRAPHRVADGKRRFLRGSVLSVLDGSRPG